MSAGRLTTHVLDTASGRPAADMLIELFRVRDDARVAILSLRTNEDGRTGAPLLADDALSEDVYELLFHAGDYLRDSGHVSREAVFLDRIPVRFTVTDAGRHYHVPLLLSPFGYSTYRGS